MGCADHQRLFDDEGNAWAAWKSAQTSRNPDQRELEKLFLNANAATGKLKSHMDNCDECKKTRLVNHESTGT
jgi:hypothetical protein